jgi:rSAM/selenodomain-associated transferase 2/rSAM/selenodomain-associated transferase 1
VNSSSKLIIFTRFPEAGKTKTRLIPSLGAEGAALLQRQMTEHTVKQARRIGIEIEIRYTGGTSEQMRDWLGSDLRYADQGEGDLGERMERAFFDHFSAGVNRIVIIGSDCPSNDSKNMVAAFQSLENADCVFGPAHDGGYYLIGLNKPMPHLFQGVEWGGGNVLEQTLSAAASDLFQLLERRNDVDLPEDLPKRITVIIPTLNEEEHLSETLRKVDEGFNVEAIVVDGGSMDGTRKIAEEFFPHLFECEKGRAAQQNKGALAASGEILLFLHADTLLPDGWDWIIRGTLSDPAVAAGAFSFRIREQMRGLKFIEDTANWRSQKGGLPYGDQGLFMRKETFESAGGFPDIPIMEDYAFVRALRSHGKIVTVPQPAITSGRRWREHGVAKVTLVNKLMILGYHFGVSPQKLAAFYRRKR